MPPSPRPGGVVSGLAGGGNPCAAGRQRLLLLLFEWFGAPGDCCCCSSGAVHLPVAVGDCCCYCSKGFVPQGPAGTGDVDPGVVGVLAGVHLVVHRHLHSQSNGSQSNGILKGGSKVKQRVVGLPYSVNPGLAAQLHCPHCNSLAWHAGSRGSWGLSVDLGGCCGISRDLGRSHAWLTWWKGMSHVVWPESLLVGHHA